MRITWNPMVTYLLPKVQVCGSEVHVSWGSATLIIPTKK